MAFSIDTDSAFGARAASRLAVDRIAWLVTVNPAGQPQPNPVWYLWDGQGAVVYSQRDRPKLRNIQANPRVAFHLDTQDGGDDVVILSGVARVAPELPPANEAADYIAKYADGIAALGMTPERFAADYSVPVRFDARRIRGY